MKKPSKPRRKSWDRSINVQNTSLQHLLDSLPSGIDYNHVELETENVGFYDSTYVAVATYEELESDESFEARMAEYEARLEMYNQWRKDNAEQIAAEEEKARRKKESREKQKRLSKIAQLKRELKKLEGE